MVEKSFFEQQIYIITYVLQSCFQNIAVGDMKEGWKGCAILPNPIAGPEQWGEVI